jgi:hypothetical protein
MVESEILDIERWSTLRGLRVKRLCSGMHSGRLALSFAGMILLGCGSDEVEPPLRCEPGPVFVVSTEACVLTVEGSGAPTAALRIDIEADDGTPWTDFVPASDGGLFLFSDQASALVVARLGPDLEFMWSRRLSHDADGAALGPFAASDTGIDVVSSLTSSSEATPWRRQSWLTHIDSAGICSNSTALEFGGDTQANAVSLVRDEDRIVLAGLSIVDDSMRTFVQQRTPTGSLVAETELLVDWGYIDDVELHTGGSERYLANYRAFAPQGVWSDYYGIQWLDEALTVTASGGGGLTQLDYQNDASGRLYKLTRDAFGPEEPVPEPTTITVTPLASADAPASNSLQLSIPPDCELARVRVRDEALQVLSCRDPPLRGYSGSGDPTWTASLECAGLEVGGFGRLHFDAKGRLWLPGDLDGHTRLFRLDYD